LPKRVKAPSKAYMTLKYYKSITEYIAPRQGDGSRGTTLEAKTLTFDPIVHKYREGKVKETPSGVKSP